MGAERTFPREDKEKAFALRQGGSRLPELEEEPAEGRGEPRTIERPRVRARFVDQEEPALEHSDGE